MIVRCRPTRSDRAATRGRSGPTRRPLGIPRPAGLMPAPGVVVGPRGTNNTRTMPACAFEILASAFAMRRTQRGPAQSPAHSSPRPARAASLHLLGPTMSPLAWIMLAAALTVSGGLALTLANLRRYRWEAAAPAAGVEEPLVSVCIPARNEEANIEACVRSLLRQDWSRVEIMVYDDQSTDTTPEILARLAEEDHRAPRRRSRCRKGGTAAARLLADGRRPRRDLGCCLPMRTCDLSPAACGVRSARPGPRRRAFVHVPETGGRECRRGPARPDDLLPAVRVPSDEATRRTKDPAARLDAGSSCWWA